MANQEFKGEEKRRFPGLVAVGVVIAIAVAAVAFAADSEFVFPVLILAVICVIAAVGYRVIAGRSRSGGGSDADSESNFPRQEARFSRPLGDTPEAHDELSIHDIPVDAPERHRSEEVAEGQEKVFRGPVQ